MPYSNVGDRSTLVTFGPVSQRRTPWLASAVLLFAADLVLHLPITDACDAIVRRVGWAAYDATLRQAFPLAGLVMLALMAAWPAPSRRLRVAAFAQLLVAAALAQRLLLVAGIENVHYPQYALLVCLLSAGGLQWESAWMLGTVLGAADELYQLTALPRGTPAYFDWNDLVLNALGAGFGVIVAATFSRTPAVDRSRVMPLGRALMAAAGAAATAATFELATAPFYTRTAAGHAYHKLGPAEASLIVTLLWLGVRRFATLTGRALERRSTVLTRRWRVL